MKDTYQEAVAYMDQVPKFTKKNKPENTLEMVQRLGHPERSMKVIHVAGTNGKGSVCAFLSEALTRAGKRTALFTSPHLVEMTERFQMNGKQVRKQDFARAFQTVKQVVDEMVKDGYAHPAYFELLFGIALVLFQKLEAEYLVLETGLGGRLDATNLVEHPSAVVLTTIGMDHMEYLGDTVEKIAAEKAGIIKEGVPVIYDGRNPKTEKVILAEASKKHAPVYPYYSDMSEIKEKTEKSIDFILDYRYDEKNKTEDGKKISEKIPVTVPFLAEYQVVNSSLALLTLKVLFREDEIGSRQAAEAIANTRWQGRMETVLPGIVFDGAHNADGIREFIRTVKEVSQTRKVSLLFSAVSDKEYETMIRTICEQIPLSHVTVTQIEGYRIVGAKVLGEIFKRYTKAPVCIRENIRDAFETARAEKGEGMLFCAGSLYLIGALKEIIAEENEEIQ